MTGEPAVARAASVTLASQWTWSFAVTVIVCSVMVGSGASAQLASGFTCWEGN
jgi:hypothetical protein